MSKSSTSFKLTTGAGTVALMGTAICFGLVPLFARELQAAGVDSSVIALSRYLLSALVLLPFLPLQSGKRRAALLMGGAGMAMGIAWIGYLESLESVPVGTAGVVYMSYPMFTLLFAWLLAKQCAGKRGFASALLILLGAVVAYTSGDFDVGAQWALLLTIPAPLTFGLAIAILCTCTYCLTPTERMACAMLGAAIGLAPLALSNGDLSGGALSSPDVWILLGGMALMTALIPQYVYSFAAPRVGPSRAAAAGSVELPTMMAVGLIAFGEPVGEMDLLAAFLVMVAVGIAPAISSPQEHSGTGNPSTPSPSVKASSAQPSSSVRDGTRAAIRTP